MERWQQIESLFQEALERDPAERNAWLREACQGDSDLRREVASLLANHQAATDFKPWAGAAAAELIDGHASLEPGQCLGPYRIECFLAAGGMGKVYRATDTRLHRQVAIKVSSARFSERFEREARVIASLNHPHICQLYDVGPNYLVMELVEGPTLADRIRQGALPLDEALVIARQIAEGLEAAHEKGRVHRDLKPANVKITPEGLVKLLDFGLAKAAEEPAAAGDPSDSPTQTISATRTGVILGTAAYMSPEQARGAAVDKRSDIWAFGVVLYEMLAGRALFTGETTSDILAGVLRAAPDWNALPGETPPRIRRLLRRCLERDRKLRLQAIGEARIAIDAAEEREATAQGVRFSPWPWGIAAVLAVALVAVGLRRAPEPLSQAVSRWTTTLPVADAESLELARDGTRLVYGSGQSLLLRMLDGAEAKRLPGAAGVGPVFSPDGQWIAYYANNEKLRKIPVTGGTPIDICDAPGQRGRTWGDDDTIVFGTLDGGLMRVTAGGGTPYVLTAPDRRKGEIAHQWPQFLPGAGAIVFTINTGGSYEAARIAVLDLKHRSYRTVVDGAAQGRYVPSGHLVYARSATLFAAPFDVRRLVITGPEAPVIEDLDVGIGGITRYAFSNSGLLVYFVSGGAAAHDRAIQWMDRHGKAQNSDLPPRLYTSVRLSPEGRRVALTIANSSAGPAFGSDIWIGGLERGDLTRLTSKGGNSLPLWTPEGRCVTFSSKWAGRNLLYRVAADGSGEPELLLEKSGAVYPMSWTANGDLLFYDGLASQTAILPIRTGSGQAQLPSPETGMARNFRDAQVSPDGRLIAYMSNESGRYEIYVQSFPALSLKKVVSLEGGETPRWARSGQELFYLDPVHNLLMAVDVQTGSELSVGHPHALFPLHSVRPTAFAPWRQGWDVASDGQRFLVIASPENQESSLKLVAVVNWFDELRRLVPRSK
jgi:serine/threonine-protein kinase